MRSTIHFALILFAFVGCQRDESIVSYRAPKEPPHASTTAPAGADAAHDHAPVIWTLPAGWKDLPAAQMRFASIQAGDDPNLVLTVIALSPNQAVLPNINRWEGQIGLPPSSETEAVMKLKQFDVAGAKFSVLDLNGPTAEGKPAQSILVAWSERPDHTWYFKLQGPAEKVAQQKANFDAFVQSIKFETHEHAADAASIPQAATAPTQPPPPPEAHRGEGGPKWSVPQAWQLQPDKPMRVATYRTSADAIAAAEVVISRFPQFGGMLDNINRWRSQVGLAPVTNESATPPQHMAVGASQAEVYDFTGDATPALRVRVVLVPVGQETWFFKLQGPADAVAHEQAAFDQFVQSVRF